MIYVLWYSSKPLASYNLFMAIVSTKAELSGHIYQCLCSGLARQISGTGNITQEFDP